MRLPFTLRISGRQKNASTVAQTIASLLAFKESEHKSARHLSDMRSRLGQFSKVFGERPIGSISHQEIDEWLALLNLAPLGHNNSRRVLANLFYYAADRGLAPSGIMRKTARRKVLPTSPRFCPSLRQVPGYEIPILPSVTRW